MDDPSELAKIAKGLKSLSIAVWMLVVISLLQAVAWIVPMVAPGLYLRHTASSVSVEKPEFESWTGLSIEEKIKRSSVVLITENKIEGKKLRAVIKEIPKQLPGTTFYYTVGEEYPPLSHATEADTRYGEGSLVLLKGSPASMGESYAIYNGSIYGLGDMPTKKIREIIEQLK